MQIFTLTLVYLFGIAILQPHRVNVLGNELEHSRRLVAPIVINTWNFTQANRKAWAELSTGGSALDAVEAGCRQCQTDRCDSTVGWGGSPSETGETTLDSMIMDGTTYNVGAVGGLRRVKDAIGVARMVLERTNHTLLVGEMATQFALELGFKEESLTSDESRRMHQAWLSNTCQPNYWSNVEPDPRKSCGPYHIKPKHKLDLEHSKSMSLLPSIYDTDLIWSGPEKDYLTHDTIGVVAYDAKGNFASATSTNGLRNKIQGRVGDSPVPGAGSYAAKEAGAAAATGDGDVLMRHLLSYQAVENLRQGMSPEEAALDVIHRLLDRTEPPYPLAGIVVVSKDGRYGAACAGIPAFPYVLTDSREQVVTKVARCVTNEFDRRQLISY